jgi:hypothetical protein
MVRKSISSSSSAGTADSSNTAPSTPAKPVAATPATPLASPVTELATNPLSPQTTAASNNAGAPLAKAPTSRLAKTLTWGSKRADKAEQPKKPKKPTPGKPLHPSERPLTEGNLRHQELLSAFSMNFGRRRASQGGGRTSFASNISPMGSRQASLDGGPRASYGGHGYSHLGPAGGDRRFSSLAREGHEGVPPDVEEEGSQTSS